MAKNSDSKSSNTFDYTTPILGTTGFGLAQELYRKSRLQELAHPTRKDFHQSIKKVLRKGDIVLTRDTLSPDKSHALLATSNNKLMEIYHDVDNHTGKSIAGVQSKTVSELVDDLTLKQKTLPGGQKRLMYDPIGSTKLEGIYRSREPLNSKKFNSALQDIHKAQKNKRIKYTYIRATTSKANPDKCMYLNCGTYAAYPVREAGANISKLQRTPRAAVENMKKVWSGAADRIPPRVSLALPLLGLTGLFIASSKGKTEEETKRNKLIGAGVAATGIGIQASSKARAMTTSIGGALSGALGSALYHLPTQLKLDRLIHNKNLRKAYEEGKYFSKGQRFAGTALLAPAVIYGLSKLRSNSNQA